MFYIGIVLFVLAGCIIFKPKIINLLFSHKQIQFSITIIKTIGLVLGIIGFIIIINSEYPRSIDFIRIINF